MRPGEALRRALRLARRVQSLPAEVPMVWWLWTVLAVAETHPTVEPPCDGSVTTVLGHQGGVTVAWSECHYHAGTRNHAAVAVLTWHDGTSGDRVELACADCAGFAFDLDDTIVTATYAHGPSTALRWVVTPDGFAPAPGSAGAVLR